MKKKTISLDNIATITDLVELCDTYVIPVRQSGIIKGASCPRKFLYENRFFLHPKSTSPISARSRGSMVHKCLELDSFDKFDEWVMDQIKHMKNEISEDNDMFNDLQRIIDQYCQQAQMAKMIVTLYKEKHGDTTNIEVINTEKKYSVPANIDGTIMELEGTLDQVLKHKATSAVGIRDYKTTGQDADFAYAGYSFGIQNRFYRLLTYLALGFDPKFFILDILVLPSIRMSREDRNFVTKTKVLKSGPNKGEIREEKEYIGNPTFDNYLERCKLWYANNSVTALPSYTIYYSEPVLTPEFLPYLKKAWQQSINTPNYENFPRDLTTVTCKAYNKVCPFMDICNSNTQMHMALLKQRFQIVIPEETKPLTITNDAGTQKHQLVTTVEENE